MPNLVNIQIILILAAFAMGTPSTAFAQCTSCGAEENWTASAYAFLEGKPIDESGATIIGPQLARSKNTEFNSDLLKMNLAQPSNGRNNLALIPSLNIDLNSVYASPNPVNSENPVMLNAEFGTNGSKLPNKDQANNLSAGTITVYAIIKNLAGIDVGKVNLNHVSGMEYAGIWNANVTEGIYNATIIASSLNSSRTFSNVLQIGVNKPA